MSWNPREHPRGPEGRFVTKTDRARYKARAAYGTYKAGSAVLSGPIHGLRSVPATASNPIQVLTLPPQIIYHGTRPGRVKANYRFIKNTEIRKTVAGIERRAGRREKRFNKKQAKLAGQKVRG